MRCNLITDADEDAVDEAVSSFAQGYPLASMSDELPLLRGYFTGGN